MKVRVIIGHIMVLAVLCMALIQTFKLIFETTTPFTSADWLLIFFTISILGHALSAPFNGQNSQDKSSVSGS